MKILVVEDEFEIRRNLVSMLKMEGHEALEAGNGLDGLELARLHRPGLILSDIMMPGLDGYGMLEQLRIDPLTSVIPLIFLTAKADREETRRGMKLGADDYITKPFSRHEILDAINSVWERRRVLEDSAIDRVTASFEDANRISRHDIKTPLSFLAAAPALLRAARDVSPQENAILNMMEVAAKRAIAIVDMTLAISQIESDRFVLRPVAVNLSQLVLTVADELAGHAKSKDVCLQIHGETPHIYVHGEETLCYSILANLLKNAIEASPDRASVQLQMRREEHVTVSITNKGSVPESIRASFFEKYATSGKPKGIGLGTYSSRLFAKAQGGNLTVDSSFEGFTTVTLTLAPLAADMTTESPDTNHSAKLSISALVVDDDEFNLMVMQHHLSSANIRNATAANGRLALEIIAKDHPDIIFLDIEMPVMGGIETLGEIKKLQMTRKQTPSWVVAFSGNDDAVSRAKYLELGFDSTLPKSCTPADVQQLLERLSGNRRGAS